MVIDPESALSTAYEPRVRVATFSFPWEGELAVARLRAMQRTPTSAIKVRDLMEVRLVQAEDPAQRLEILRQMLQNALASGAGEDEIETRARAVLERDPADLDAFIALRGMAENRKDWPSIAELYRSRAISGRRRWRTSANAARTRGDASASLG